MKIRIQDLLTLTSFADGGRFFIKKVTGLGTADIRTSSFLYSGRDGGQITAQTKGFRTITINGIIGENNGTAEQHALDRQSLMNALPIGTTFPIYLTNFAGKQYRADVNVTDIKLEYRQRGMSSDYLIQLTAGDPLFYSTDGGDVQTATVNRTVDNGGYVTPYILPVIWDTGGAPTVVTNSGNAVVYPVITIKDTTHNPIITNLATGEQFALNISTADGDQLVIDMANRTVKLNGSDVIGNRAINSTWWGLLVGGNAVRFDTNTPTDNGYAVITWRNGVTGI